VSRILVWSPNYAPELTGIPPLVTDAAEWLASRGHVVRVVTAVPNYPERRIHEEYRGVVWRSERRGQVTVDRSWLRVRPAERFLDKALYELTFATVSLPGVVRGLASADVVVCVVPSLLAAVYSAVLRRIVPNRRLVIWVQDLVLEAGASIGFVGQRARRVLAAVRPLEVAALKGADHVVVCSPGFRDHYAAAGVPPSRMSVIQNWVDTDLFGAPREEDEDQPIFLYAGNFGYTQGFETLIDAAREVGDRCRVVLVGSGNAAADVRERAATLEHVAVLMAGKMCSAKKKKRAAARWSPRSTPRHRLRTCSRRAGAPSSSRRRTRVRLRGR